MAGKKSKEPYHITIGKIKTVGYDDYGAEQAMIKLAGKEYYGSRRMLRELKRLAEFVNKQPTMTSRQIEYNRFFSDVYELSESARKLRYMRNILKRVNVSGDNSGFISILRGYRSGNLSDPELHENLRKLQSGLNKMNPDELIKYYEENQELLKDFSDFYESIKKDSGQLDENTANAYKNTVKQLVEALGNRV